MFEPSNWYWRVGNDAGRVYSSKAGDYVADNDPAFLAWGTTGLVPTAIATEALLGQVLAPYRLRPAVSAAGVLNGYLDEHAGRVTIEVPAKLFMWLVNEVRALKGQPSFTAQQFRGFVKGQM
jgi:hypothetical protein